MKKVLELILCAVLIFSATALTACEDRDDDNVKEEKTVMQIKAKLYFANEDYINLGDESKGVVAQPVEKTIELESDDHDKEDIYEEVLKSLESYVPGSGQINCLANDMIDGVKIFGDEVIVDMESDKITSISDLEEKVIIAQIVDTLMDTFPKIKKVRFTVDENNKDTLNGHVDITQPFSEHIK